MMNGRDPLIVVDIVVPEAELVRRLGIAADVRQLRRERGGAGGRRIVARRARGAAGGWCSAPTTTRRSCSSA